MYILCMPFDSKLIILMENAKLLKVDDCWSSGLEVLRVAAEDNDDPLEGGNAQVMFSIEKNVLDEQTGTPIFSVDSQSGLIRTTICCLDREKTAEYSLRVVATDGGGLKGKNSLYVIKYS